MAEKMENADMETNDMEELESEEEEGGEGWIFYTQGVTQEPFQSWLNQNLPSSISKSEGVDWISVSRERERENSDLEDFEGLERSFEMLQKSGRPVNYESIKQIACNHNSTSGKWLFFAESGGKIDHLWSLVADGIVNNIGGPIPCFSAKVSTCDGTNSHVVCIYNENFTNKEQVMDSERAIRNMGIKCRLQYKPDVFTHLNIYGSSNPMGIPEYKGLRPYILLSNYDLKTGSSIIESLVDEL